MPKVKVLPFDRSLGFPQIQTVRVNKVAYRIFYQWNPAGGYPTIRITRIVDNSTIYNGKLVYRLLIELRDPDTYELLFSILPWEIKRTHVEVYLYPRRS